MADFYKPIPAYLTTKRNIVQQILFTAAFALVFINVYEPFGVNVWFKITRWELLLYSSLITLTGVLIVVISRIVMYYLIQTRPLNTWHFLLWVLAEILLMALFYSLYIKLILHDERFFPDLIKLSIQNTSLLLLLPYSVSWLYFSWKDKNLAIARMVQGQAVNDTSKRMVPFTDEKGVLRFSVKMENLLYLEASDNYVSIYYLNQQNVNRFMLRTTLKNIEEEMSSRDLVRCHRSYMVNCEKVRVIRREKDGVRLELDLPSAIDIPVTKTYLENVMKAFSHYSQPD